MEWMESMRACPQCGGETFAVNVVERGMCNACTRGKETEAQDWLRVRAALSTYMSNQLPDGLRFEDGTDFKQCIMDVIDDLAQEVSA